MEDFDPTPWLLIYDEVVWYWWALKHLSIGCYYGGFEVFEGLEGYVAWTADPWMILRNFFFNFGFIYATARDLLMFLLHDVTMDDDKRTSIKSMYELGEALGKLYYFVLIAQYYTTPIKAANPQGIVVEGAESPADLPLAHV